jgi:hypothetical protein
VRWYEAVEMSEEEQELGMEKVKWESTGRGKYPPPPCCPERYDVIDIATIVKSNFLQPHPTKQDVWFYNHYV